MIQPFKIQISSHDNLVTWEGPWDSSFDEVFEKFLGLCSTLGFGDVKNLKETIETILLEEKDSEEEYNRRKEECPAMFQN